MGEDGGSCGGVYAGGVEKVDASIFLRIVRISNMGGAWYVLVVKYKVCGTININEKSRLAFIHVR